MTGESKIPTTFSLVICAPISHKITTTSLTLSISLPRVTLTSQGVKQNLRVLNAGDQERQKVDHLGPEGCGLCLWSLFPIRCRLIGMYEVQRPGEHLELSHSLSVEGVAEICSLTRALVPTSPVTGLNLMTDLCISKAKSNATSFLFHKQHFSRKHSSFLKASSFYSDLLLMTVTEADDYSIF